MTELTSLPANLPKPHDDGASDHLVDQPLPPIEVRAVGGGSKVLNGFPTRWLVLYVYPRTGGPGIELPDDWDMIPGARGCTPQSCAFRDHYVELSALDATVWGLSAQPIEEQVGFSERMHIPFPLLNDTDLMLSSSVLALPTFEADGMTLYRRLTLVADASGITKVFYPVFPPDRNATDVIHHLRAVG
ncbi:MAG: peroxiredoxin [Acidimicrobiia bacterium]|nr:peroxiredoxin [Acidimicrobiia bacterium]